MTDQDCVSPGVRMVSECESRSEGLSKEFPLLQIELSENASGGCLARISGHLVGETIAALWSIEPMMANENRVVLDLSGVVAIDGAGLEATVRLMDAIRAFGGSLTIGRDELRVVGVTESLLPRIADH